MVVSLVNLVSHAQALYSKALKMLLDGNEGDAKGLLLTVSQDPAHAGTHAAERALAKLTELGGM